MPKSAGEFVAALELDEEDLEDVQNELNAVTEGKLTCIAVLSAKPIFVLCLIVIFISNHPLLCRVEWKHHSRWGDRFTRRDANTGFGEALEENENVMTI